MPNEKSGLEYDCILNKRGDVAERMSLESFARAGSTVTREYLAQPVRYDALLVLEKLAAAADSKTGFERLDELVRAAVKDVAGGAFSQGLYETTLDFLAIVYLKDRRNHHYFYQRKLALVIDLAIEYFREVYAVMIAAERERLDYLSTRLKIGARKTGIKTATR